MAKGRPRAYDPDRVLDAAARLFRRDGYEAVGVAELCRETGLATQSLYNHFGDKAGLYRAALRRYGETANGPQIASLSDAEDALAALRRFVDDWRRHAGPNRDEGCLFTQALALADVADGDSPGRVAVEFTATLRRTLAKTVRRAVDAGQLSADTKPARLADGLLTLAFGTAVVGRGGMPAAMIGNASGAGHALLDAAAADA